MKIAQIIHNYRIKRDKTLDIYIVNRSVYKNADCGLIFPGNANENVTTIVALFSNPKNNSPQSAFYTAPLLNC